jgi:hypothetical protein
VRQQSRGALGKETARTIRQGSESALARCRWRRAAIAISRHSGCRWTAWAIQRHSRRVWMMNWTPTDHSRPSSASLTLLLGNGRTQGAPAQGGRAHHPAPLASDRSRCYRFQRAGMQEFLSPCRLCSNLTGIRSKSAPPARSLDTSDPHLPRGQAGTSSSEYARTRK